MRTWVLVVCLFGCGEPPPGNMPCGGGASGTVTLLGSPQHHGVFHDRDGTVLSQTAFDAQGTATGVIPPCGAVTFVKGTQTYFTVTQVMPGDTITLRYPQRPAGARHSVSVTFPLYPGATDYAVRPAARGDAAMTCGGFGASASPITRDFDDGCIGDDGTISFLAVASGDTGALAYASFEGVPLAAGGTTTVSITEWRTDLRPAAATFVNLPGPEWTTGVQFGSVLGGMYGPGLRLPADGLPVAGTHATVQAMVGSPQGQVSSLLKVMPAGAVDGLVIDAARDFAPLVSFPVRDNAELARPVVEWMTSADPTSSDAIAIDVGWDGLSWFLVAPPGHPAQLRFPELPAELRPTTTPYAYVSAVIVGNFSPMPTYAELRRDPLALWFPTLYSDPVDTLVFRTSFAGGDYDLPNID